MKQRMWILSIVIILSMLLASVGMVQAQDEQPPRPVKEPAPVQRGGSHGQAFMEPGTQTALDEADVMAAAAQGLDIHQNEKGEWIAQGSAEAPEMTAQAEMDAMGGDGFGYSSKAIPFNWVDASHGTELDMSSYGGYWITLPFSFPYYGGSYDDVLVTPYGNLNFDGWINSQSPLPYAGKPNNVIAPYWSYLDVGDSGSVYYDTGSDSKGNYIVFQWTDMTYSWNDFFTFEALLYEDGTIVFQYDTMDYYYYWNCASAGIEDWTGTVGVSSLKYCSKQKSQRAIRFSRPKPAARLQIFPLQYGNVATPGGTASNIFTIQNTGDLTDDVFDLTWKSKWPLSLYRWDGESDPVALTDTDGDKKLDTGPVGVGERVDVMVSVTAPVTALVGQSQTATITAASSLKTSRKVTVELQTTIPAPFALGYTDSDFGNRIKIVDPVNGINRYEFDGYNAPALTTLPNGNIVQVWSEYYCDEDDVCLYEEVYYRIVDHTGAAIKDTTKLVDLSAFQDVWDFNPAVAATPDGSIAIAWVHETYDDAEDAYMYNIFFAVLDSTGAITYPATNLTNNTAYYNYYDDNTGPRFYYPRIAAVANDRFAVAWEKYQEVDYYPQSNIFTEIVGKDGSVVQAAVQRTFDTGDGADRDDGDDSSNFVPSLTRLTSNRFLLAWSSWTAKSYRYTYKVSYQVLDMLGQPVTSTQTISCGSYYCAGIDAAQMSTGQIVMAWGQNTKNSYNGMSQIYYTVLNDGMYKKAKGPVKLTHKAALTGAWNVSVTTDTLGRAILVWGDDDTSFGLHGFYALLGKNGTILTKPAIIVEPVSTESRLYFNSSGYATTNLLP